MRARPEVASARLLILVILTPALMACSTGGPPPAEDARQSAAEFSPRQSLAVRIELSYSAEGRSPSRQAVPLGADVQLLVRGDEADQLHLTGYERYATILAGGEARISFVADSAGRFVLERDQQGDDLMVSDVLPPSAP